MNQVLMFSGTNLEKMQWEINKMVGDNELTIQSVQMTSVLNPYDVIYYTIVMVVTK